MQDGIDRLSQAVNAERLAQEAEATVNGTHAVAYRSIALISSKGDRGYGIAQRLMAQQMAVISDLERSFEALDDPTFKTASDQLKAYKIKVDEASDASAEDVKDALTKLQDTDSLFDELLISLQTLGAKSRIQAEAYQEDLDSRIALLEKVQAALLLISVLAGLVLSYYSGIKISSPLRKMQAQLEKIEKTSDFSIRAEVESGDEVGKTAESLNALLSTLQNAVSEVNVVMMAVAEGDLSRRVETELKGDMGVMKNSLNDSMNSVQLTIDSMNKAMNALENGDFSMNLEMDQIKGEYRNSIEQANNAIASLRQMIGNVGEVMEQVANGKLNISVTANGRGDLSKLRASINASLESLRGAMRTINTNARQVASASNETSQAIGQISDGAQNQTHAIGQVASAIRQTATSVAEVSRSTDTASIKSKQSVALVLNSRSKMDEMVHIVNNIAANSEKINKITSVIESIANKTNLLSLNAAIEAARAGEHGKGFAVVADEVGKLALSSAESSQEIAILVRQAVEEANRAVKAVEGVTQELLGIESGSKETDQMLQRIAATLEQQNAAVEEINVNLSNVDRIAQSNAAASEEITATVIELSRIADATRNEVEKFSI